MTSTNDHHDSVPVLLQKIQELSNSVLRLEGLIEREINELKSEQIAELKRQNERLADDQRRAWDAIRELENQRNQAYGGVRAVHAVIMGVSALLGAAIAALITKFMK